MQRIKSRIIHLIRALLRKVTGFGLPELRLLSERCSSLEQRSSNLEHFRERFRTRVYMSSTQLLPNPALGKLSYGYEKSESGSSYRDFEDIFRGSEEFIKNRLRSYGGFFNAGDYVLEIGCGRGEFLELLAEWGVRYVGVDSDESMVERCREKGLSPVLHKDYESYFTESTPASFDAVFSAQFIEHIPSENITDFFRISHAALKPGGVLVAETVNPYSIEAFRTFHVDLTHQKILYPEVLIYACRVAGFQKAAIYYPNHNGYDETQYDVAGEYAIVAYK